MHDDSGIFISYRQDDSKPWAVLLRDALAESFGDEHVFLDKDGLRAGKWQEQLHAALDRTRVVLVVIGQRWLTSTDAAGGRRLWNADDVHRQEIAIALARPEITVIPVRVDQAALPRAEDLPPELRPLLGCQSREISDSRLRRQVDLQVLTEDIERATKRTARRKPLRLGALNHHPRAAFAVVCAAAIAAGWIAWHGLRSNDPRSAIDVGFRQPESSSDPPINAPQAPAKDTNPAPTGASTRSPGIVPTSLSTAVETRNDWGSSQTAEDGIDPDRIVTYQARLENGISRIRFDVPYLARLAKGGTMMGINYSGAPFKWRFPELSIRAVNNTSGTMVISEAQFEVIASRIIAAPVITVEDLSIYKLVFHNEGWGEIVNPSVELNISESGQQGGVSLFAPASHTVRLQSFSDSASISLSEYLPDRLRSSDQVLVDGVIAYGEARQRQTIAFRTRVLMEMRSGAGIPPTHFYDLTLTAGESGVVRQVPLAQELKAGASDHFVVRVGADKSSTNRLHVTFRTVDGTVFDGGQLAIDIFVPRSAGRVASAATVVR